jgi:hypothetical protein
VKHWHTQVLILATIVIWIIYDIIAFAYLGNPDTESATIARWGYHAPGIAFLCGLLMGHFFFSIRGPMDWPKDHDND